MTVQLQALWPKNIHSSLGPCMGQQPPGIGEVPSPASAPRDICITAQHIIKDTIVI